MNNHLFKGLNDSAVLDQRKKFGENTLPEKENFSVSSILFSQFKSPLVYILLFVALISLILKEYTDFALIGLVIIFNTCMGFYQEYNAHKILLALRQILKPKAIVIRNGKRQEIETTQLVPGDIVVLIAGDKVPADGKMVDGINLLINESILTGEEEAIKKSFEKQDMLFMGTTVIAGKGLMEVTKIGINTQMGKIGQSLLEIKEEKTPLQLKLEKFSQKLAYIVAFVCLFIFLIGIFHHENIWQIFKIAIILAVAAIPEGLPIAVTIILSLGMKRILKRQGLVKRLLSVETLGSTSIICTDKTGTLTKGIMEVVKTDFQDQEKMLYSLIMTNEQKDGLELCLWEYVKNQKLFDPQKILNSVNKIYEEPFDSAKKYSQAVINQKDKKTGFILGAPEIILEFSDLSKEEKNKILTKIENWADEGLKILGAACKENGNLIEKENYSWLGLIGIEDPVRPGVKQAIVECQKAGIKIKIVTGDYLKTAERVAKNLGFQIKPENILESEDLEKMSDQELKKIINNIVIFSRITPHQKLKIVKALQDNNEIVAMTGDGVNDALALKKSNIAIVVENATDVAKEVADLILLDSNFKTIVAACEEGRLILSNIKKVIGYVLSNSFAEIMLIFSTILLDLPAPLTIVSILWIHLICDGPPDIVLGFEDKNHDLMQSTPQQIQKENIFDKSILFLIFAISISVGLLALFFFKYFLIKDGIDLARTMAFATIATASLIYIFSFKNLKQSIFRTEHFFQNKYLFLAVIYGLILIIAAVYLPVLNKILGTTPLNFIHWLLILSVGLIATFWVEITKFLKMKFNIQ